MEKKVKLMIGMGIIVLSIIAVVLFCQLGNKEKELEEEKYLTSVEIKSTSNFILLIDKDENISNVIFLNHSAINRLNPRKIEGKSIEKSIESIVDQLKNNQEWKKDEEIKLVNYGHIDIFNKIKEEFNKEFVIYGINNKITDEEGNLDSKIKQINPNTNNASNLKVLYDYSNQLKNTSS